MMLLCMVVLGVSTAQTIETLAFAVKFLGTTISVIAIPKLPRSKNETIMPKEHIMPVMTRCGITEPRIHNENSNIMKILNILSKRSLVN